MSNKHLDRLGNFLDFVSIVVVAFVVIIITILSVWMFRPTIPPVLDKHEYNISLSLDTTIKINQYDSLLSDVTLELEKISLETYEKINEILLKQEEVHNSFREAESRQTKFLTYASALIAIIAALGGFFGFKSITDIRKSIQIQVEEIAKKEAREAAKRITEGSVKTDLKSTVTGYVEEDFLRLTEDFERRLNDLKDQIDECCQNVAEHDHENPEQGLVENPPVPSVNASTTFNDEQL